MDDYNEILEAMLEAEADGDIEAAETYQQMLDIIAQGF
jgi:hypothetical protein